MNQNKIEEMLYDAYFKTKLAAAANLNNEEYVEMIEATESIFDDDYISLMKEDDTRTIIETIIDRSNRDVCTALNVPRVIKTRVQTH